MPRIRAAQSERIQGGLGGLLRGRGTVLEERDQYAHRVARLESARDGRARVHELAAIALEDLDDLFQKKSKRSAKTPPRDKVLIYSRLKLAEQDAKGRKEE